jgi:hypothetical protein
MEFESSFSSASSESSPSGKKRKRSGEGFEESAPAPVPEAPLPFRPPLLAEIDPGKSVEQEDEDEDEKTEKVVEDEGEKPVEPEFSEFSESESTIYDARPAPAQAEKDQFEEIMEELGPEYAQAASGDELTEPVEARPTDVPETEPPERSTRAAEAEQPEPVSSWGSSPVGPPPPRPPAEAGYGPEPSPEQPRSYEAMRQVAPAPVSPINFERQLRDTEETAEKRGLRRGLIAGFITAYVLKSYLDGKRREREAKKVEKQFAVKDEQISHLQTEQQRLQAQMMRAAAERTPLGSPEASLERPTAETLPPVKTVEKFEDQEIYDQEGNRLVLQPGWHIEKSPGGYSVVLDEKGRLVENAIVYGEGFRIDAREKIKADSVAAAASGVLAGTAAVGASSGAAPVPEPTLPSGQADFEHELPAGPLPKPDINHRLPPPRNRIMTTIANPWLWTAIAILLIVYFLAALS